MKLGTTRMRRLGAAAGLAIAATTLTACGGGSGSDAPENASTEDFCNAIDPRKAMGDLDMEELAGLSEDEQKEKAKEVLQSWAEGLADVGTPENIPDDARKGYEEAVDQIEEIDWDASMEDVEKQLDDLETDSDDTDAFEEYVKDECDVEL